MRIGLISDTHNLLRPEALDWLAGCDHLIHAGDIGGPDILDSLRAIAPLTVVRGNNDMAAWADGIAAQEIIDLSGVRFLAVHDIADVPQPLPAGVHIVVTGHSHKPVIRMQADALFINPGSAGPRRFSLPIAVGDVLIAASGLTVRTWDLINATLIDQQSRPAS